MTKSTKQLHEEFVNECRYSGKLSEKTLRGYSVSFEALISIFPDLSLDMLSPKIIAEFFMRLDKRKRIVGRGIVKQGVKKSTVASYQQRLGRFFDWLVSRHYITENPLSDMPFPTVSYEDVKYLKKHEIEKTLTAVSFNIEWSSRLVKKRNMLVFTMLLYTGIRKNELLNIRLLDLDMDKRLLTIRGEHSKSGRTRILPMCSKLMVALNEYLSERKTSNSPKLFVSCSDDEGMTEHALNSLVKKVVKYSGIRFHVHQFRHTFAVNLINQGVDISKVKQLLGHKSIMSTIIYVRCLPVSSLRKDVECLALDDLL